MGILTTITESNLPAGTGGSQNYRDNLITEGVNLFQDRYTKYSSLAKMFESDSQKEQYAAALTTLMLSRTESFIDLMHTKFGESTVTQNLGALNKRLVDIVRIFYPSQIATELVDIQPINGQVGEYFVMKPRFSQSIPGVTAGTSEIFINRPTYNNYASEEFTESVGTGNGATATYSDTLVNLPVRPGTLVIKAGSVTATDDGAGALKGSGVTSGTIDYVSGAVSITFSSNVGNAVDVSAEYRWDSEKNESGIRQIEFDLTVKPVNAKLYPVLMKYSVAAGLAASTHLGIDVGDTLTTLMGEYIKNERDDRLVALINSIAGSQSTLNFDCQPSNPLQYDKRSFFGEIELKLDEAESLIQNLNGRGGVDWVLCGRNAANVFRQCRSFRSENVVAPIGAHKIGTLRDGTVSVVKSLTMNANSYIFGFKGYQTGDAGIIMAEWIPMYFSPTFEAPTLSRSQGVFSAYDMKVENSNYFVKGTLSN